LYINKSLRIPCDGLLAFASNPNPPSIQKFPLLSVHVEDEYLSLGRSPGAGTPCVPYDPHGGVPDEIFELQPPDINAHSCVDGLNSHKSALNWSQKFPLLSVQVPVFAALGGVFPEAGVPSVPQTGSGPPPGTY
jgi:hypothetical protein